MERSFALFAARCSRDSVSNYLSSGASCWGFKGSCINSCCDCNLHYDCLFSWRGKSLSCFCIVGESPDLRACLDWGKSLYQCGTQDEIWSRKFSKAAVRITQEGNSADTNVFTRESCRAVHLFSTDETFLHPHICILEEHERIRLCRRHTSGFQ